LVREGANDHLVIAFVPSSLAVYPASGPFPHATLELAGVVGEIVAEALQQPGEQPGDLHLADVELGRDLGLFPSLLEAQEQQALVSLGQALQGGGEYLVGLYPVQVPVVFADLVSQRTRAFLPSRSVPWRAGLSPPGTAHRIG
jgi:hypothetical protein